MISASFILSAGLACGVLKYDWCIMSLMLIAVQQKVTFRTMKHISADFCDNYNFSPVDP